MRLWLLLLRRAGVRPRTHTLNAPSSARFWVISVWDVARCQRIGLDVKATPFRRHRPGQIADAALGCGARNNGWPRHVPLHRIDVDDLALPAVIIARATSGPTKRHW
jgi:hypothetical protein